MGTTLQKRQRIHVSLFFFKAIGSPLHEGPSSHFPLQSILFRMHAGPRLDMRRNARVPHTLSFFFEPIFAALSSFSCSLSPLPLLLSFHEKAPPLLIFFVEKEGGRKGGRQTGRAEEEGLAWPLTIHGPKRGKLVLAWLAGLWTS